MKRVVSRLVGLAVLAVLAVLAMSCGQNGPTTAPKSASNGADVPTGASPTSATDPLVGEWRQDFSCEDNVKTFHRLVLVDYDDALYRKWVRDFAWGPNAENSKQLTSASLCKGAPDRYRIMKVANGVVTLFDPPQLIAGNPATYELLGDHTFTLNDGGMDIADCDNSGCTPATYRYTFKIVGDRMTIVLHHDPLDPWGGTPFEVAPFYRMS